MPRAQLGFAVVDLAGGTSQDIEPRGTHVDHEREPIAFSLEPERAPLPEESPQEGEWDEVMAIEVPEQSQDQEQEGGSEEQAFPSPDSTIPSHITAPLDPANPTEVVEIQRFNVATVLEMHRALNEKTFQLLEEETEIMHISEDTTSLECTICLDGMEEGQMITRVPCDGEHVFHHECLNTWMATKLYNSQPAFCPNCNCKLLDPLPRPNTGSRQLGPQPRQPVNRVHCRNFFFLLFVIFAVVLLARILPQVINIPGVHEPATEAVNATADVLVW